MELHRIDVPDFNAKAEAGRPGILADERVKECRQRMVLFR